MHLRLAICCLSLLLLPALFGQTNSHIHFLVPGFTARELPIKISNINNLRFTPRGELSALGYDGRVHILRDTDGDGIEDQDTLFWDKSTLSVPVGMVWSADGLYVSSHGKVSLLRDTDHDGKADIEEIIASGWPPTDVASGGVDATAVTFDRAGNLYFGLLTADYSNPYRVSDGISHYDLKGPRGTIQKWSAATKQLETIATGIRVPYTLAFNRLGDLFVTDQEGETWCPNGNPLDELNQIIPGRNYGFPPRQEKYLPNLISEAPVVAFAPQHQSTCGLIFNELRDGQKPFGPTWWEGDAFVAGESRGKIWRVRLMKTPAGYVGEESLIARLDMLTMDLAISPKGQLYVTCHSGSPDWGTGPQGEGKIFQIFYTDKAAPQPVAAWASGPLEVQVAFDKPIDPLAAEQPDQIKIEFGEYVAAADRFEVLKPPYKVVGEQEATPRGKLRVISAKLSPDGRILTLGTDPHPQSVTYALTLPGIKSPGAPDSFTVDLTYHLHGVEASWSRQPGQTLWNGWLPHLDSRVCRDLLRESTAHAALFQSLRHEGFFSLKTLLTLPKGANRLRLEGNGLARASLGTKKLEIQSAGKPNARVETTIDSDTPKLLTLSLRTSASSFPDLTISFSNGSDPNFHPLSFSVLRPPWAPVHQDLPRSEVPPVETLGGDYERGRALFFGEGLKCSTCHKLRGEGASIGPDLSNLAHRDAASVLRDITEPNLRIHPDYVAYNVQLQGGDGITGFLRAQSEDTLRIIGVDGKENILEKKNVLSMQPSSVSLMPAGLLAAAKDSDVRDLLTFLLNGAPTRSPEDLKVLRGHPTPSEPTRALNLVLVASKQDHGPKQHDYPDWQKKWLQLFSAMPKTTVSSAWEWPTPEQFEHADAVVLYFWNHDWSTGRLHQLDAFLERGGGLVVLHSGTIADKEPERLAERIGLAAQPVTSQYRHMPLTLNFAKTPITLGLEKINLLDEPYWPLIGDTNRVQILATAEVDAAPRPLIWTYQQGKGRVFASIPSHYTWTWEDPLFRTVLLRGLAWAVSEPPDRFSTNE
ncbi:MAG TPA: ThuA domain-containing protein [Verrucomicrobiae bacterium]|nr:ThuA domain-containing protein [Verrucomicrobiae bacterium]